jgi:hypothetical protein
VSVYAAPRDGATARGKDTGRPDSLRVLTGSDAQLRSNFDEGSVAQGCVTFNTVPVPPYAGGGGGYTAANISGNTLTLPGGSNQGIWLELRISNWACSGGAMGTWQAQYGPDAALPVGITRRVTPCADAAACFAAGQGCSPGGCPLVCSGGFCDPGFEQQAVDQPTAMSFDIEACNTINIACGATQVSTPAPTDDGIAHYAMSIVLSVSAAFTGSASINVQNLGADTFFQDPSGAQIPIGKAIAAVIEVPLGRCCVDPCTEGVPQGLCSNPALWGEGLLCPANGGPPCAQCQVPGPDSVNCGDGDACTADICTAALQCDNPESPAIPAGSCCNPANNARASSDDGDPCTLNQCSLGGNRGVPQNPPAPAGAACDDDNPCTADDVCTGGDCGGRNVNGDPCTTDADCTNGGDTPGAVCDGNACSCSLVPDLNFVIDDEDNCFSVGEKISVAIHVGPGATPIAGGQFAITFDPTCLDFVSIGPAGPPYTNEIQEIVGHVCVGGSRDGLSCNTNANCPGTGAQCVESGTIFYAIGIELGGCNETTPTGDVDMAIISFLRRSGCEQCELCFTNVNPLHTYLSSCDGQPINVASKCSKTIHQLPNVEINGPDNVKLKVGCNSAVACTTWDAPTATSDCDGVVLECTGTHLESGCTAGNCCGGTRNGLPCTSNAAGQCPQGTCFPSATSGGCFPVGNTNFCCTAVSDKCGVSAEHCWTVTVNDATALDVEIQLSPTMVTKPGGGIIRCIEFEVFSNCVQAPLTFCEDVVFGGLFQLIGHFNGGIKIPSQVQPECISARDKLHTLRSCFLFGDDDCDDDGVLHATFKGDPFFGGNWLIGGNLDGWKKDNPKASHDVIDILDFGQIVSQWMHNYGTGDTPCPEDCHPDEANADINGDGIVDLLDYSFVSMNFLEDSKDCCCPGSASSLGNRTGLTEISVAELIRNNMKDLTVADLNNDGMVNLQDMAALMQGVRPTRQAPDRDSDKGTSGSRSINR